MKISTHDLIIRSATQAIKHQSRDGSMPSGCNGPHQDPETPVRATSHWLITFLKAYEMSSNKLFLRSAEGALRYLLSAQARPHGFTFRHRTNPAKDACNGLIGQAWTTEALLIAAKALKREDLHEIACQIYEMHDFDPSQKIWYRREITGEKLSQDMTFNHILWFAAVGSKIRSTALQREIAQFICRLDYWFQVYASGLIMHVVPSGKPLRYGLWNQLFPPPEPEQSSGLYGYKDHAYHQFNLYAFALLYEEGLPLPFLTKHKLKSAIRYMMSDQYLTSMEKSPFGYGYNVAGFECAYVLQTFYPERKEEIGKWIERQLAHTLNTETWMLDRNTQDPVTLSARIYELTRLPDLVVKCSA